MAIDPIKVCTERMKDINYLTFCYNDLCSKDGYKKCIESPDKNFDFCVPADQACPIISLSNMQTFDYSSLVNAPETGLYKLDETSSLAE